jgi:uncharacterized protein YigE (DUF2233 family)
MRDSFQAWLKCLAAIMATACFAPAQAVDCTTSRHQVINFTTCAVDLTQENLRLYLTDAKSGTDKRSGPDARGRHQGQPLQGFGKLREMLERDGERLVFAMNAGMFHPDYRPVGLLVIDGIEYSPLNKLRASSGNFFLQPNGVFWVGPDGGWVGATEEFNQVLAQPLIATQSGPMLVHRGQIPDIPAFAPQARSRHIRNGVCTPTRESILFVISEKPVTFREMAEYFLNHLGCTEALYLDGSISSLYSDALRRDDDRAKFGPVFAVAEPAGAQ